ncbi:MAG TPA: elongation factor P [Candidatus Omnitrophota bacterium]|nr:elongation factor P [Candidatus Omnitrophota bacterium]MDD5270355.1 elongation factor P [Candidatus Omnitrophota bacterium]MDD5737437.1 elongation factor P [Candidatus Omnitrophota bacterium]HOX10289.1 elongation factor P [Candidatus Omnitrophota bacterium]HPN66585.1 elongation factor P [Candidatus Omnitrophota bacterium]
MISTSDLKNGLTIKMDGQLFQVIEFQHVKPGKGGAFVKTKLRSLTTGNVLPKTFRSGEKLEDAFIEYKKLQFLYVSGDEYHFMEEKTYEQFQLTAEQMGDVPHFLKENMVVNASFYEGKLMSIEPPMFVELAVVEADPGLKGDTAKSGTKAVKLETGYTIQVPLFVEVGNVLKIDTRTGGYVERV